MSGLVVAGELAHGLLPSSAVTPASIATLRWSSHGYTTAPSETPASTHYDARLRGAVSLEQSIRIGGSMIGRAALGFGELELWDGDGELSSLLTGYAIDGRTLRLRVGDATGARIGAWPALSSFSTVFAGSAAGWRRDGQVVRVRLRDLVSRLDVPGQTELYGGTGGVDGPAQLKGIPKPCAWGQVFNVSPTYLGVVDLGLGALATFQVHYRQLQDVTAVRERGAAIARVSGTPGLGQYVVHPSLGVFQLGFTPAGTITADVQGDAAPFYAFTPGRLAQRIATDICALSSTSLDLASVDDFDFSVGAAVGVYVSSGDRPRAIDIVEALIGGVGGLVTQTRGGLLRFAMIAAPELLAHATLEAGDIRAVELLDLPDSLDPPPKRVTVGYSRNYTPSDDLAGAIVGAERAQLAQAWRVATSYSSGVAAAHVLAQDMPIFGSCLADEAPAQALSDAWLELYRPGRRRLRVTTGRYLGQLELGYTVAVTFPLFGLLAGWRGVIEGLREDWLRGTVELTLYG